MRRLALLILAAVALLAGCGGTSKPAVGVQPRVASRRLLVGLRPQTAGVPVVGEVLTTTNGTWTNSPTSFVYQWQHCASSTCTNITGATAATYTIASTDLGDTIQVVVTATNAGGSASQTSAPTGVVANSTFACNLNATTSNLAAQVSAATSGQSVCLASGNYTGFAGTSKAAPGITITSAPGAAVTFNSGISLDTGSSVLNDQANWTLDGTAGGGTITIGGTVDLETTSDAVLNKALNVTFQNLALTSSASIFIEGPENSNITFNRDTFVDANAPTACNGYGAQVYMPYTTTSGTPSGVSFENSVFVAETDMWNPNRGLESVGAPFAIENDVITGFLDHTEGASCNHIDSLQLYSGTNGTGGGMMFAGNLCYDDYDCFAAFDGTSNNTIADNACFDMESSCVNIYADTGSVMNHNTQETGGADPGGCMTMDDSSAPIQGCSDSALVTDTNKSGDRSPSGETFTNNIDPGAASIPAAASNTNNMWPGAVSPNISGSPTFVGGAHPTTWAGFELTSGSTGHAGGSDGLDVGIRASAGGPPTGGGSAPVDTAAPSVTGTATHGDVLTTTAGTWTITGNVPTAITYQWFDCPTVTFSLSGCTPIEAETTAGTNGSTYTLQTTDEGDYVFAYVTVTNANGQVNAVSNPVGPVN